VSTAEPHETATGAPGAMPRRGRRPGRLRWAVATATLGLALVATGCTTTPAPAPGSSDGGSSTGSDGASGTAGSDPTDGVPEDLEDLYTQKLTWSDCADLECASVKVPLDYDDPQGETIELALNRLPATGEATGSLVINPGGPGGSGTDYVKTSAAMQISADVRKSYDVVGFDPRGVGRSTAVACQDDETVDRYRETARIPTSASGIEDMVTANREYAEACSKNTPDGLLEHLDTESAARDLDLIRGVLGEDQLDYLGFSYGTKLGATYLRLFPSRAGRVVLDGAMDPALSVTEVGKQQATAFETSLDHYLASCLDGEGCPFTGSVEDARKQLAEFMKETDKDPLPTEDGRVVPATDVFNALLLPLYEPTLEPSITQALKSGMEDRDGSQLLYLADVGSNRSGDGSYTNTNDAFTAINCVDYQHESGSVSAIQKRSEDFEEAAPFFGAIMGYDDGCSTWPVDAKPAASDVSVKDPAHEPLIVGTTHDPATPYAWSKALQKLIPGSRLLTFEGYGHTAYGRSNECVTSTVDTYLLDGSLPKSDKTC
jgi:pimeloyl-ACP methyl ester carboxylesterase